MDAAAILAEIKAEFPGRPIVCLPPERPTEIVVEIERTTKQSVAIAFLERSRPHGHHHTTEEYVVERGVLRVHLDKAHRTLSTGESITISPHCVHWAESVGAPARVRVTATPPWMPEDHILV